MGAPAAAAQRRGVRSGRRNLHAETKDGRFSKEQNRRAIDESSRPPAAATGLRSFVCAPFIHHLFPGQPKPDYSHLHIYNPLQSKALENPSDMSVFATEMTCGRIKETLDVSGATITVYVILQILLLLPLLHYNY